MHLKSSSPISLRIAASIVIALILVVGLVYLGATFNTASTTNSSTSICQGFPCSTMTPSNSTTSTTHSYTTETAVSNFTGMSSTVTKATSESVCIPTPTRISTTTLTEQSTTRTEQVVYDGTVCSFGDNYFEPPSAILIPANTLVWTSFELQVNASYYVGASIHFLSLASALGANITVAVYQNADLGGSATTPVSQVPNEVTNSSLLPPSNSTANSIFVLTGLTPAGGVGVQSSSGLNMTGTISIAFMSDKPLWISGWTAEDLSRGTGSQFGHSPGQLNSTYEWTDSGLTLPNTLPQPTTTLAFELQISGSYFPE
jgi:hypothetical protein